MRGDRPSVCAGLAEQQRLDEAPQIARRVQVLQQRAQPEQLLHVAPNVDVAVDVRLGEAELVQAGQRPHAGVAADSGAEGGRPVGGPERRAVPSRKVSSNLTGGSAKRARNRRPGLRGLFFHAAASRAAAASAGSSPAARRGRAIAVPDLPCTSP